jgi:hypothetical protein
MYSKQGGKSLVLSSTGHYLSPNIRLVDNYFRGKHTSLLYGNINIEIWLKKSYKIVDSSLLSTLDYYEERIQVQ